MKVKTKQELVVEVATQIAIEIIRKTGVEIWDDSGVRARIARASLEIAKGIVEGA